MAFSQYLFDLATADGSIGNWNQKLLGAPLILRKMLENWGYYPPIRTDANQVLDQKVRLGYRKWNNDLAVYLVNTEWGSNTVRNFTIYWNFTSLGMDKTAEYIVFFEDNSTVKKMTGVQLEHGITVLTHGNGSTNVIAIRSGSGPCVLWTNGFIEGEISSTSTYTLVVSSIPNTNIESYIYIPWGNPVISCSEDAYEIYPIGDGLWKMSAYSKGTTSWTVLMGK
jgi:hypothetical protein